jgi:uncharacterized SAM-binding protein YcdF (DUF218 family)
MKKIGLLLFLAIGLVFAGRWLVFDEPPRKADVIIVLAGDRGARTEKGVALWRQGYAPYIMVSGGNVYHNTNIADLMAEHAMELGVPRDKILVESLANTTYQNAVYTKDMMQKNGFHSAIIVSSDFHMRRVWMAYQKVFKGQEVELTYCPVRDADFDVKKWWSNNQSIILMVTEYVKLIGYSLGRET